MNRRQIWGVTRLRAAATGLAGGALAAVLAVVPSPAMPLGLARVAEPDPGLSVDVTVMALGVVAVTLVTVALTGAHAARVKRDAGDQRDRTTVGWAERLGRLGFSPAAVAGVRLAVQSGRGRTAAPVRATILGIVFSIAALTTALALGASLDHLLSSPRLYGWN